MDQLTNVYGPPKRINKGTYSLGVMLGAVITGAIDEAISVARALGASIRFEFNEVAVTVRRDSDPKLIYRDWLRALHGYIDKKVGPYPKPVLTDEDGANDAKIEAGKEAKRQVRQREAEEEQKSKSLMLENALAAAPKKMTLRNKKVWKTAVKVNSDGYGSATIRFAERWARLMEGQMANGNTLEACAKETSHLADNEGITGFMYGCAVSILAQVWEHGEALRKWHNLDTQIGNEGEKANESGGILNPAVLVIGKK